MFSCSEFFFFSFFGDLSGCGGNIERRSIASFVTVLYISASVVMLLLLHTMDPTQTLTRVTHNPMFFSLFFLFPFNLTIYHMLFLF